MRTPLENPKEQWSNWRQIIDINPNPIFANDRNGCFIWVNKATADFYGTTTTNMSGKRVADFIPDAKEAQVFHQDNLEVMDTLQEKIIPEVTFIDAAGQVRYLQIVKRPIIGPGGVAHQTLCACIDVTERKNATEALRSSEARYRAIVEDQTELISRSDPNKRRTFVNEAYCRYYGVAREELIGHSFMLQVFKEDRQKVENHIASLGRENPVGIQEFRAIRPDGEMRWNQWITRAIFDEQGNLVEYQSVGRDITKRKQAEEELKHRNEELMALNAIATTISELRHLDDILQATLDKTLEVVEMEIGWIQLFDNNRDSNKLTLMAQRGFSQTKGDITRIIKLEETMMDTTIHSGQPVVVSRILDYEMLAPEWVVDIELIMQEGIQSLACLPLKIKDKVLGVLGCFSHNPREWAESEVQLLSAIGHQIGVAVENDRLAEESAQIKILQELDRFRSELIANVSHELRTPLGLIKLFVTTLLREDLTIDREIHTEFLHNIDEETGKLEKIVDNLLDLSRLENNRLYLEKCPTDVSLLAKNVLKTIQIQFTQHHFVQVFPEEPLIVVIDPKRIEQVLRNLLVNAVKYSPEGGTITVEGYKESEQFVVLVRDQGIGIPAQNLEQIFERFYRVENKLTKHMGGTGLGLAVCRGIVEAHGGHIYAESTPGVGSTFYFTLPVGISAGSRIEKQRPNEVDSQ